ncbi:uncharacterized protein LOC144439768 [Glandiceps talaboti]
MLSSIVLRSLVTFILVTQAEAFGPPNGASYNVAKALPPPGRHRLRRDVAEAMPSPPKLPGLRRDVAEAMPPHGLHRLRRDVAEARPPHGLHGLRRDVAEAMPPHGLHGLRRDVGKLILCYTLFYSLSFYPCDN